MRLAMVLLPVLIGCAAQDRRLEQALTSWSGQPAADPVAEQNYQVHCPDVLTMQIAGPHPWQGEQLIGPDGKVHLDPFGTVRVEGLTTADAGERVASQLHVRPDQVQVKVTAYKSQQVFLYGEVAGLQRPVPYQGPETIVELLQRAGGLTPGAATDDIQVVRTHVADGKQPEVFQIDLNAILLKKDNQTNIRIEPFDQVYIGQAKRCCVARCLPPWLRCCCERMGGKNAGPAPPGPMPIPPPNPAPQQ